LKILGVKYEWVNLMTLLTREKQSKEMLCEEMYVTAVIRYLENRALRQYSHMEQMADEK
jgi:hypothetical protein